PIFDSLTQETLSGGEKLDHCLASSARTSISLSMQLFFSRATAGSRNVTPPCLAMPSQTCSTLRSGTLSATGSMSWAPSASAVGKIMDCSSTRCGDYSTRWPQKQQCPPRLRQDED